MRSVRLKGVASLILRRASPSRKKRPRGRDTKAVEGVLRFRFYKSKRKQNEFQDLADFVLGPMKMTDNQKQGLQNAADAVLAFVDGQKIDNIMGNFNCK